VIATGQRFSLIAIASAMALCGLTIAFNLVVDPYGFYRPFESVLGDRARPAIYQRQRLAKAYDLRRIKPLAIVLGTSRSHIALRMTHPGWGVPLEDRYNSAFDGATTREMYAYLMHAQAIRPLRQVVLGLDTWHLNHWSAWSQRDFEPALLFEPGRPLHNAEVHAADVGVLISVDTTKASFDQLRLQLDDEQEPQWFGPDGQRLGDVFFREVESDFSSAPGAYFRRVDRLEITDMLDTRPVQINGQSKFGPDASQRMLSSLDYVAKIVTFCRDQDIDLRIFVTPAHVHQLEILAALDGWTQLEQSKRDLVELLADDAAKHPGARPFPLYDFSGYSSVTTEPVPPDTQPREMKFYWDSSHFKESVGDWVLDRLFGVNGARDAAPPDFGFRLAPADLGFELERDRINQATYRREHPNDIVMIKTLIEEVKTELAKRDGKT
jgi:hypothetical protein